MERWSYSVLHFGLYYVWVLVTLYIITDRRSSMTFTSEEIDLITSYQRNNGQRWESCDQLGWSWSKYLRIYKQLATDHFKQDFTSRGRVLRFTEWIMLFDVTAYIKRRQKG